jgi:hypothetical protein
MDEGTSACTATRFLLSSSTLPGDGRGTFGGRSPARWRIAACVADDALSEATKRFIDRHVKLASA